MILMLQYNQGVTLILDGIREQLDKIVRITGSLQGNTRIERCHEWSTQITYFTIHIMEKVSHSTGTVYTKLYTELAFNAWYTEWM